MSSTAQTVAAQLDPTYLGTPPLIDWVPTARCFVDRRYQRTIESRRSQALIERIATQFTWRAFGSLIVAKVGAAEAVKALTDPRSRAVLSMDTAITDARILKGPPAEGDFYAVLDGQHRLIGAQRRGGVPELPALIHLNMSMAEQAMAFAQANDDRVAVNQFALYHARLLAGDDSAQQVDVLCQESGLSIPRYPMQADQLKPGETLALGTLGWLLRSFEREVAVGTACAVANAWHDQAGAVRAAVLKAVAMVLKRKGAAAAGRVEAFLARHKPVELRTAALRRRAADGGSEIDAYAHLIRDGVKG